MKWSTIFRSVALALSALLIATIGRAEESTPSDERQEYVSTADHTELIQDDLAAIPGKEVRIYHSISPAGWVGKWHYHTGDVFVYVVDGQVGEQGEPLMILAE